jgi:hypothetical protein
MSLITNEALFSKNIKIVILTFTADGPLMINKILTAIDKHGKQYGTDYVVLPYIPGWESGMSAFAKDTKVSGVDASGRRREPEGMALRPS